LEYHLILAHDTKVISEEDFRSLVTQTIRVRKMLYALLKCLSVTIAHPLRRLARTKQPARSRRPTRHQPPAGSHQLQFINVLHALRYRLEPRRAANKLINGDH
jgi:hypothetical protein